MSILFNTNAGRKRFFLYFFILILLVDLLATSLGKGQMRFVSKPLLMLTLGAYFLSSIQSINRSGRWVIGAIFFSWLGDVLLMFEGNDPNFFLFGLFAFLAAHVLYIYFFHKIKQAQKIKSRAWLLLIVVIYYGSFITFLYPSLREMKFPVAMYGVVISFMLLLALHMPFMQFRMAGISMMKGAILFVLSDSILAINKFYQPFVPAATIIMLTYGLAQFFIINGAIHYLHHAASDNEARILAEQKQQIEQG